MTGPTRVATSTSWPLSETPASVPAATCWDRSCCDWDAMSVNASVILDCQYHRQRTPNKVEVIETAKITTRMNGATSDIIAHSSVGPRDRGDGNSKYWQLEVALTPLKCENHPHQSCCYLPVPVLRDPGTRCLERYRTGILFVEPFVRFPAPAPIHGPEKRRTAIHAWTSAVQGARSFKVSTRPLAVSKLQGVQLRLRIVPFRRARRRLDGPPPTASTPLTATAPVCDDTLSQRSPQRTRSTRIGPVLMRCWCLQDLPMPEPEP